MPCNSRGEDEGVLDLDTPWLAAAEAESRLEEAMKAFAAESAMDAEEELDEDEIRDNRQRQDDEV